MALSGIPIDPQQCIGDSLEVLNNSFIELDSRTIALSTSVGNVPIGSDLYSLVNNVSSIALSAGVTQIVAGSNITISGSTGVVTISSTGGGGLGTLTKYTFTGNGVLDAFTMTGATATQALAYRVDLNGVLQEPGTDYTISGTTLQFSSPPGNGVKIVVIEGSAVNTSVSLTAIDLTDVKFTNEYTTAATLTADDTKMLKVIVEGVDKYLRLYDIN